jgi:hypothetical protein
VPNAVLSQVSPTFGFGLGYLAAFLAERQIGVGDRRNGGFTGGDHSLRGGELLGDPADLVRVSAAQALNRRPSRAASRIVRPSRRARSWRTSSVDGPDTRARIGGASRRRSFRPGMTKPIHGIHAVRPKR